MGIISCGTSGGLRVTILKDIEIKRRRCTGGTAVNYSISNRRSNNGVLPPLDEPVEVMVHSIFDRVSLGMEYPYIAVCP